MMALATGLGSVPFLVFNRLSPVWSGASHALASGVMLAASFDLIHEGGPYSGSLMVMGILVGVLFIQYIQRILQDYEDVSFADLKGANARRMLMIVGIMAAHSLAEGAGVGVSFGGRKGWIEGVMVAIAIGIHNIPEGLAVATVLIGRGTSPTQATFWSILTSLPQPIVAVPSFIFVEAFRLCLPFAMGFAAGCMIWMVFAELIPASFSELSSTLTATIATFSAGFLECFRLAMASLETPDGHMTPPVHEEQLPALIAILLFPLPLMLMALMFVSLVSHLRLLQLFSQSLSLGMTGGILLGLGVSDIFQQLKGSSTLANAAIIILGYALFNVVVSWLDSHLEPLHVKWRNFKAKAEDTRPFDPKSEPEVTRPMLHSIAPDVDSYSVFGNTALQHMHSIDLPGSHTVKLSLCAGRSTRSEFLFFRAAVIGLFSLVGISLCDGVLLGKALSSLQISPFLILVAAAVTDIPRVVVTVTLAAMMRKGGGLLFLMVGIVSVVEFIDMMAASSVLFGWELGESELGVTAVHCIVAGSTIAASSKILSTLLRSDQRTARGNLAAVLGIVLVLVVKFSQSALCQWSPCCIQRGR